MASCHLLRPEWLWLLLPLALLLWLLGRRRGNAGRWQAVCEPRLLPYILQSGAARAARWPLPVTALAGLLAILALAGPACEQREQPVFRDPSALVIALDLSRSMDATDIKPSRLARARLKLIDILKQRREGQAALIVYAAEAFTVSPLTDDANTIISLVNALDSNMMPLQGSDTSAAVARATQLLQQAGVPEGDILLISDGIDRQDLEHTLAELKGHQHRLSVLAVGTAEGAPIALRDGGFLKDSQGAIVVPKLDTAALQQLARQGGGRYHRITAGDGDINHLLEGVDSARKSEAQLSRLKSDQWREAGPWLLLPVLLLAALAFRRGHLALLAVVALLPLPQNAEAVELADLWRNDNQQALHQLKQGNAEAAARLFNDPHWRAAARYRAGQYEAAVKALEGINTADALYNKGNALARLGDYPAAIEAYEQALKLDPDDEDARHNRDLVKAQLQQQKQSQSDQTKGDQPQQDGQGKQQSDRPGQQGEQQSAEQQPAQRGDQQQADSAGPTQDPTAQQQQAQQQAQQEADEIEGEQQQLGRQQDGEQAEGEEQRPLPSREYSETAETDIATEQWLRRIPDDPGGLLRRKFQYQYQQQARQRRNNEREPW